MKKLILKQDNHATAPYKVIGMECTIEWNINSRLKKDEVERIIIRGKDGNTCYHRDPVKVVIK